MIFDLPYDELRQRLINAYGTRESLIEIRKKFFELYQHENESVEAFYYRLKGSSLRLGYSLTLTSAILERFEEGLRADIAMHVLLSRPSTVEEAVKVAGELEDINNRLNKRGKGVIVEECDPHVHTIKVYSDVWNAYDSAVVGGIEQPSENPKRRCRAAEHTSDITRKVRQRSERGLRKFTKREKAYFTTPGENFGLEDEVRIRFDEIELEPFEKIQYSQAKVGHVEDGPVEVCMIENNVKLMEVELVVDQVCHTEMDGIDIVERDGIVVSAHGDININNVNSGDYLDEDVSERPMMSCIFECRSMTGCVSSATYIKGCEIEKFRSRRPLYNKGYRLERYWGRRPKGHGRIVKGKIAVIWY